jgi:phage shock protein PspC (stress-responsive transcriptional regulator)
MNKTVSVNIAGFAFNIEEQAYEVLRVYLKNIRNKFQNEEEQDEIMEDIEARVAELFHEKISAIKEVITETDVQEIMDIMGKPEDYLSDEFEDSDNKKRDRKTESSGTYFDRSSKRLFRDEDNGSLGGVCAGLGHYFNADAVIFRVLFVLLVILGGSGILAYIIMWIVIPEAKTTADKLQMKGQSVNLDSIKQHFNDFKENTKTEAKNVQSSVKKAVNRSINATSGFVNAFSKVLGTAFILGGVFAFLILMTIFFGNSGLLPIVGSEQIEDLPTMIEILYPGESMHNLIFISVMVVSLIPIISIIITGIRLLADIKKPYKPLAWTGVILWILGVGVLAITGVELGMNFRSQTEIEFEVPLDNPSTEVLYVDVNEDDIFSDHISFQHVWNYSELIKVENERIYMGYPEVIISPKEDSADFEVKMHIHSNGLSIKDAISKAESVEYNIEVTEDKLLLPPYYSFPKSSKIRQQQTTIEIKVPLGKRIEFGKNIDRIGVWLDEEYYHYPESHYYAGTVWTSDKKGLKCPDCGLAIRKYSNKSEEDENKDDFDDEDSDVEGEDELNEGKNEVMDEELENLDNALKTIGNKPN